MPGPGAKSRTFLLAVVTAFAAAIGPGAAHAHVERTSFWPDPAPDRSVEPAAGGAVPHYRNLGTALRRKPPGSTRIVCQDDSLGLARRSIRSARKGFRIRPTEPGRHLR